VFRNLGNISTDSPKCINAFVEGGGTCSTGFAAGSLPDVDAFLVPGGGATVSSLQARAKVAPAVGTAFTVTVLNNGSPIMTCTVTAGSNTCGAPTPSSAAAAAGTYLQAQVSETTGNPANTGWFISFRY
jgi:hypothetical protein